MKDRKRLLKQVYANELDILEDMDKFLETILQD